MNKLSDMRYIERMRDHYWQMLQELDMFASELDDKTMKVSVEEWYAFWNSATGDHKVPSWKKELKPCLPVPSPVLSNSTGAPPLIEQLNNQRLGHPIFLMDRLNTAAIPKYQQVLSGIQGPEDNGD